MFKRFLFTTLAVLALAIAVTPEAEARGCRGGRRGFFARLRERRQERGGLQRLRDRRSGGCCDASDGQSAPELIGVPRDETPEVRFAASDE